MRRLRDICIACLVGVSALPAERVQAQSPASTVFTYQGKLTDNGQPVNRAVQITFKLYDSLTIGTLLDTDGPYSVTVTDGLVNYPVTFDAANAFDGNARWLEIVADGQTLTPRQPLTASPYASYALKAGPGNALNASDGDPANAVYVDAAGKVGIGTISPVAQLQLNDKSMWITGTDSGGLGSSAGAGMRLFNSTTESHIFAYDYVARVPKSLVLQSPGGMVGIGTNAGTAQLNILGARGIQYFNSAGTMAAELGESSDDGYFNLYNSAGAATLTLDSDETNLGSILLMRDATGQIRVELDTSEGSGGNESAVFRMTKPGAATTFLLDSSDGNGALMDLYAVSGALSIRLLANEPDGANSNGGQIELFEADGTRTIQIDGEAGTNGGGWIGVYDGAGNARIHLDGDSDGRGVITTDVLEITGADVAERFPVSEPVEPGMVVMIDTKSASKLSLSRGAYNRCVAGVVSGAGDLPVGAVLGNLNGSKEGPPIALSGRVWVWCDASSESIQPGDLLTTSDRPGHAMRASDSLRSHGAVLGKAMTGLSSGQGLVLTLVNLQ